MPLYDPCCGTGTLLIEAAFKATSRAPGLTRSFACESYPFMDRAGMEVLRREAREAFRPDAPLSIAGSDIDPKRLRCAGGISARQGWRDASAYTARTSRRSRWKAPPGCSCSTRPMANA